MPTKTRTQKDGTEPKRMHQGMSATRNDLPEEARQEMAQLLNTQLADLFDLFSQTKQAHWNVKGPDFIQLHELYDELAGTLIGHIDTVAERAVQLGAAATGTVRMAAGSTRIEEFSGDFVGGIESIRMLVDRYAEVAETTREAIDKAEEAKDMDTSDLFIDVSRDLDKALWFLESHIQMGE